MAIIDKQIIRSSLLLAWPISLQSILTNLLSMIDIAMVSHLGDTAVGAVGLGNRFQFMIQVIVLGIAWTVGVLSAQYYGANKTHRIRSTILQGALLANIALVPVLLLNVFFAANIIGLGTENHSVIEQGKHYLWFSLPSLCFVAVILAYDNAIRAVGEVKTPMIISAIAIVLNIALNYWFINGGLGVPAMGVTGAAVATTLARGLQLIFILGYLRYRQHTLCPRRVDLKQLLDRADARHFLSIAMPMTLGFALWSSGTFVYQIIYGRMGTEELAVMSILAPIEAIFMALFFGLASACAIVVGQRLGADQFKEAWQCARSFAVFSPITALCIGVIVLAAKDIVLLPFSALPTQTLDTASTVLALIALSTWLKVINMTIAMGVLRSGGDNTFCTYIDVFGMWIISIPLTALAALYFKFPLFFVVLTTYSEEVVKAVLFSWRAHKRVWMKNLTSTDQPTL